jgi:uncharacterized protein YqeY
MVMSIVEQIQRDMVEAMRARDEQRLSTLRMMKSTLKNKEIDKRAALDDAEAIQVLGTMIKQRKDSIEQFTKGGRQELADKEAKEIELIETYMPKAAGADEMRAVVAEVVAQITAEKGKPAPKDMGNVMKAVMARFAEQNIRADGKAVNEMVRTELSK